MVPQRGTKIPRLFFLGGGNLGKTFSSKKNCLVKLGIRFTNSTHTPPCGRLADHNRNRNVKPQLDNRNTENGIKIFWKILHKIITFFTWTPIRQH